MQVLTSEARDVVDQQLDDLAALFHEAEREIKRLEHLVDKLPIPSINELRYAGHHLSRAWQARQREDASACHDELDRATKHCKRAIYDAHEIGIQHHLLRIKQFQEDYRKTVISNVVHGYHDMRRDVNEANRFIAEIADQFRGDRDGYYEKCSHHFEAAGRIADTLEAARDDLNAKIRQDRWKVFGSLAAIAATLLAAVIVAFS